LPGSQHCQSESGYDEKLTIAFTPPFVTTEPFRLIQSIVRQIFLVNDGSIPSTVIFNALIPTLTGSFNVPVIVVCELKWFERIFNSEMKSGGVIPPSHGTQLIAYVCRPKSVLCQGDYLGRRASPELSTVSLPWKYF